MPERARTTSAEGYVLQIKKIGNSTGAILPKELLARLKLAERDRLYVVEQTERGMKFEPLRSKARQGHGTRPAVLSQIRRHLQGVGEMKEPEWLDVAIVLDFHSEQLSLFGGADGVRDLGLWNRRWQGRSTNSPMAKLTLLRSLRRTDSASRAIMHLSMGINGRLRRR